MKDLTWEDWERMSKTAQPQSGVLPGCWNEGKMVGYAKCMISKVKPLEDRIKELEEALNETISHIYNIEEDGEWPKVEQYEGMYTDLIGRAFVEGKILRSRLTIIENLIDSKI